MSDARSYTECSSLRRRAAETIAAERADRRAGHDANAAMPKAIKMRRGLTRLTRVVDVHARVGPSAHQGALGN